MDFQLMDFHVGDPVVHWTYGLGKIVGLEERVLLDQKMLYYVVQVHDLTVCVPADQKAMGRLRAPTPGQDFGQLFAILSEPGDPLSEDRLERRTLLHTQLADGKIETICRVIRDLSSFAQKKPLNDDDKTILKRAGSLLCDEWGYALSVPVAQAETELQRLLLRPVESTAV